jgi:hypothetical protein
MNTQRIAERTELGDAVAVALRINGIEHDLRLDPRVSLLDVPNVAVHFLDIPDPHTPVGARGLGEIGITGTAASIPNAVFNATGRRIRELPITLDKLLA